MAKTVKQKLRQVLREHTQIYIMYGATEASARLTYLKPDRFESKIGSIGEPIPGVALRIMDEKGRELPAGEKGELVASGPNIMQGYWQDTVATAEVLDKTGYHTGDTGYKDEDGFFYVEGRKDNLIKVGGHRINPQEIEDALNHSAASMEPAASGQEVLFDLPLREAREQFEREYLIYQLKKAGGSVGKLSESVGMERTHLYRKLRSLGIDPKSVSRGEV